MSRIRIGFIGAGRVAQTLAPALSALRHAVVGATSRTPDSAKALVAGSRGAKVYATTQSLVDGSDLVFLTVPDDAIREVCDAIEWRGNHGVVHCSGATEVAALDHARHAGAQVGGFHPLQIFSDPVSARRNLAGSYVAIEADGRLRTTLAAFARALDMEILDLPPGGRIAYHLAANLAASCLLAVLKESEDAWTSAGLPREVALRALMPMVRGTMDAASRVGIARAVSGPVARGDQAVLARHIAHADTLPAGGMLYRELTDRLLQLVKHRTAI